jgi:hypothetical protein
MTYWPNEKDRIMRRMWLDPRRLPGSSRSTLPLFSVRVRRAKQRTLLGWPGHPHPAADGQRNWTSKNKRESQIRLPAPRWSNRAFPRNHALLNPPSTTDWGRNAGRRPAVRGRDETCLCQIPEIERHLRPPGTGRSATRPANCRRLRP